MKGSAYNIWVDHKSHSYVFNGLSGSLLRLDATDREAFEGNLEDKLTECSPSLLKMLVQGRMIIADDVDELDVLRRRYQLSRDSTHSLSLTLVTSLGCNFDCPYCFEAKQPSVMSDNVQSSILRLVDSQLPHIRNFSVTWFGGEPLVGIKPLLRLSSQFIDRCSAAGVPYEASIVTNGYLLSDATCLHLRDAKVGFAQITLDGPAEVHDRMRPLTNGGGTFRQIVDNLHNAVKYFSVGIRVNIDAANVGETERLVQHLANEGLAGKLGLNVGHIVAGSKQQAGPSASYKTSCLTNAAFAEAEIEFERMIRRYGFAPANLPKPAGAPCTAVRKNELVVGSKGELYKCWESVGDSREVIGHIDDCENLNSRLYKWLQYDPFANDECRTCIALPVCMGGCAQHAMDKLQYENRCGTFRHTFRDKVLDFVERAETEGLEGLINANRLARRMETR